MLDACLLTEQELATDESQWKPCFQTPSPSQQALPRKLRVNWVKSGCGL